MHEILWWAWVSHRQAIFPRVDAGAILALEVQGHLDTSQDSLSNSAMKHLIYSMLMIGTLFFGGETFAQQITEPFVSGGYGPGHGNSRRWVDVNNDGKDDFCTLDGARDVLTCSESTGSGFRNLFSVNIGRPVGGNGKDDAKPQWVDINGDGYVDICRNVSGSIAVNEQVSCRFGPSFSGEVFYAAPATYAGGQFTNSESDSWYAPATSGIVNNTIHYHDIDEDGRRDLCYQYADYGSASGTPATQGMTPTQSIRCRRYDGSTTFSGEIVVVAALQDDDPNRTHSKSGFYDFNGDGRADFCNRHGCHIRTASGFTQFVSFAATFDTWPATGERFGWEGAQFIDFNGDGKTDFCGPTTSNRLICLLSNGKDGNRTPVFSSQLDAGHKYWRWWVDINGDGFPDFCRAVGPQIDGNDGHLDMGADMFCRLGDGGSFSSGDIKITSVNYGMPDGGRAFCDPHGTGIQTFCRATKTLVFAYGCTTNPESSGETCSTYVVGANYGLLTGFSPDLQAEAPVLKKFSDGLGAETRITYLPMTDDRVYRRSGFGNGPELSLVLPRQQVVSETRAWRKEIGVDEKLWKPLTGNANYFYKDLLSHRDDGSRGFKERFAFQEGNNTLEYTVFNQGPSVGASRLDRLYALGDVGSTAESRRYAIRGRFLDSQLLAGNFKRSVEPLPSGSNTTMVGKVFSKAAHDIVPPPSTYVAQHPFGLLQKSVNTLARLERANPRLLPISYTRETTAEAWDLNGAAMPGGYSLTTIDDFGNITVLQQDTRAPDGSLWSKLTTNNYVNDTPKWLLGRLTKAKVVSTAPTAAQQLAAVPSSAGSAPNASAMSPTTPVPTAPQPMSPAVLSAILQLLLDD
jgi:hypothetical protein